MLTVMFWNLTLFPLGNGSFFSQKLFARPALLKDKELTLMSMGSSKGNNTPSSVNLGMIAPHYLFAPPP